MRLEKAILSLTIAAAAVGSLYVASPFSIVKRFYQSFTGAPLAEMGELVSYSEIKQPKFSIKRVSGNAWVVNDSGVHVAELETDQETDAQFKFRVTKALNPRFRAGASFVMDVVTPQGQLLICRLCSIGNLPLPEVWVVKG